MMLIENPDFYFGRGYGFCGGESFLYFRRHQVRAPLNLAGLLCDTWVALNPSLSSETIWVVQILCVQ